MNLQFPLGLRVHPPDVEHRWLALRLAFRLNLKVDSRPSVEAAKLSPRSRQQVEKLYFRTMRIDIGRSLSPNSRFSTGNFILARSLYSHFDFAKRYVGDRAKVIASTLGNNQKVTSKLRDREKSNSHFPNELATAGAEL